MADGAVKNVVFDLGGVLLEWSPERILGDFYPEAAQRALLKQALFLHPDWALLDRGDLGEAELLERVAARTQRPMAELTALLDAMRASLEVKPATLELVRELERRGVPLYVLSNMSVSVYQYLRRRHDFWDAFRGIVISGEVRLAKPEPAVFEHLLTRHGLRAAETVFIDDMSLNTEAARGVGMRAIQFRDAAQCARELALLLR